MEKDTEGKKEEIAIRMEPEKEPGPTNLLFSGPNIGSKEKIEGSETELVRSLALTRSKIAKRNIVSHEALAGKLSVDALYCVL